MVISDKLHIQPELVYASIDESDFIQLPIIAKYYVSEKFNIQAGPQVSYLLEDVPDDFSKLNIGLGLGAGYDITEHIFAEARYAFQLNNLYTGSADLTAKMHFLNVGIGYRF